ncbi:MAG: DUF167 domain-containing protein [Patescibacteria group bacterium]|nr:DUF167 domain-containing protein [Patescibacteria group bacterium]MDE1945979.1 DUF167 domain-containing protein [Patescibacteria group bacterium]
MLVKVKVSAGAKRETVAVKGPGSLAIAVREPAEENRANERVIALVRRHFGVYNGEVKIVKGQHSQNKIISIHLSS